MDSIPHHFSTLDWKKYQQGILIYYIWYSYGFTHWIMSMIEPQTLDLYSQLVTSTARLWQTLVYNYSHIHGGLESYILIVKGIKLRWETPSFLIPQRKKIKLTFIVFIELCSDVLEFLCQWILPCHILVSFLLKRRQEWDRRFSFFPAWLNKNSWVCEVISFNFRLENWSDSNKRRRRRRLKNFKTTTTASRQWKF